MIMAYLLSLFIYLVIVGVGVGGVKQVSDCWEISTDQCVPFQPIFQCSPEIQLTVT